MLRGRPSVLATLKVEAEDEADNRFSALEDRST